MPANTMKKATTAIREETWFQVLVVFCSCTLIGMYFGVRHYYGSVFLDGSFPPWWDGLVVNILPWYARGVLFFPVREFCRRIQREASRPLLFFPRHLLLFSAASFLDTLLVYFFRVLYLGFPQELFGHSQWVLLNRIFISNGPFNFLSYFILVGFFYYEDSVTRAGAAKLAAMKGRLAEAQLQALYSQLHPHFLFNALNTVSAYIADDARTARRMLRLLSRLLQRSLQLETQPEVPLRRELDLLQDYLQIEKLRFQDRLRVEISVDDRAADALFPTLMLQPLVENSVRHGLVNKIAAGIITVAAEVQNDYLKVRVRDNGGGSRPGDVFRATAGVGIRNTCARLEMLYGDRHAFRVSSQDGAGYEVEIRIPLRFAGTGQ
jgi:two-component sensor histidine kinase